MSGTAAAPAAPLASPPIFMVARARRRRTRREFWSHHCRAAVRESLRAAAARRDGALPFMGELFSYLNVAETAMGGDELLVLQSGNIIGERGTEASSLPQVLG